MAQIKVQQIQADPSWKFNAEIVENKSSSRHRVCMSKDFYGDLQTTKEPWEVITRSFEFLLEREPKESILAEFDVSIISHYFPEYLDNLKSLLNSNT